MRALILAIALIGLNSPAKAIVLETASLFALQNPIGTFLIASNLLCADEVCNLQSLQEVSEPKQIDHSLIGQTRYLISDDKSYGVEVISIDEKNVALVRRTYGFGKVKEAEVPVHLLKTRSERDSIVQARKRAAQERRHSGMIDQVRYVDTGLGTENYPVVVRKIQGSHALVARSYSSKSYERVLLSKLKTEAEIKKIERSRQNEAIAAGIAGIILGGILLGGGDSDSNDYDSQDNLGGPGMSQGDLQRWHHMETGKRY